MKVEKRESTTEKRILAAMITDAAVLGPISAHWEPEGLFRNKWANLVAKWCLKHYKHYETAPANHIQSHFEHWAQSTRDESTVGLVETFLAHLSEDYGQNGSPTSAEYVVDLAATHFNRTKMQRAISNVQHEIDNGDDSRALEVFSTFNRVELGPGSAIDVVRDESAIDAAFAAVAESIVQYPDALGNFFKGALTRDAFVAYMGTPGRGKTWWLIDLAWRAMQQKKRVAFFQIGDLSQGQIMRRFMVRAAKRPTMAGTYRYPTALIPPQEKSRKVTVEHKRKRCTVPLSAEIAKREVKKITGDSESREALLKLSCYGNNTISVHGIQAAIDSWARSGWLPEIVVIDYADLLAPISKGETWDQTNENWKFLRNMSTALHCLVVTATQAKAEGLDAETLSAKHFSGDVRKLAHTSGYLGINQTNEEKKQGVYRLNWIKQRESFFDITKPCYVAGCLSVGNPAVKSSF